MINHGINQVSFKIFWVKIHYQLILKKQPICICPKIRQSTIWYTGLLRKMTCQPSVWKSKYYFFSMISYKILRCIFLFFYEFTKIKPKNFECPKSIRNYDKKCLEHQMLGWRVICPSNQANQRIILYVEYQISNGYSNILWATHFLVFIVLGMYNFGNN